MGFNSGFKGLNVAVFRYNRHIVASLKLLLLILRNWISRKKTWVIPNDIRVIRYFVEISALVQKVKWGNSQHDDRFQVLYFLNESNCGFGGLEVACWPLVPKFAGSHPAEAVGFLGRKNLQHALLRRGSISLRSHIVALRHVKDP